MSHFSGEKVTFGLLWKIPWGGPQKSLFSHFRVTLNFSGIWGFWEVRIFLTLIGEKQDDKEMCFEPSFQNFFSPPPQGYKREVGAMDSLT